MRRVCRLLGLWLVAGLCLASSSVVWADPSVARLWDDAMLDAIRRDTPRPTVHARNLFHTSIAMYDAWAAYSTTAQGYLDQEKASAIDIPAARDEAVSFAAYRVLHHRFANSPGAATTLAELDQLMAQLGYDRTFNDTAGSSPAALGNRIGQGVIEFGLQDGANEANNYKATNGYLPVNAPLIVKLPGTTMVDPNHWQPLAFDYAVTQNGLVADKVQTFITPHWNNVAPFALTRSDPQALYHDPGAPPQLGGADDAQFKAEVLEVIRKSSSLDPFTGRTLDISPAALGNNTLGTNDGQGYAVNPVTGQAYVPQVVREGDLGRVLAEFWADGPHSETPPGHWNVLANQVGDSAGFVKQIGGTGPVVDDLEWDVKLYFALNGAVHDAAITAWGLKNAYDGVRPVSMIRYMGSLGQSSDPNGPSYNPQGLPLEPGLVEVIPAGISDPNDPLFDLRDHAGQIAINAWLGQPANPATQFSGAGWMLAENWLPFQANTFVTPAFPGYISGHSTFSRSAAEVLTAFTGSPYFPGGLGQFTVLPGELDFERGPTKAITLEWASYYDAADQAGQSRLWGGIHVSIDDLAGRRLGSEIGQDAYALASRYFVGVPEPRSWSLALVATVLCGWWRRRARG